MLEKDFIELEAALGKECACGMRKIYSLTDDNLYKLLVGLYDPESGGFYYAPSGRDTEGFFPNAEATRQSLITFKTTGLFYEHGGIENALPKEIKEKICSYMKGLQSSEDGYFYHPHWGKDITVTRRGRDLTWCTEILRLFGDRPLYNCPNGISGSIGNPENLPVTGGKKEENTLPEYLKDEGLFRKYLKELGTYGNSYVQGSILSAQSSQIKTAGEEFIRIFADYLYEIQNKENGLWEDEISYEAVNGLMKISSAHATLGIPIPNSDKGLSAAVKMALREDLEGKAFTSVYNTFVSMDHILNSVRKTEGEEKAEELRAKVIIPNAGSLAEVTYKKILPFKRSDGGFSYFTDRSSHSTEGAPAAVKYTKESDTNATCMEAGLIKCMFSVFGLPMLPMFSKADGDAAIKLFLSLPEVKKIYAKPDYLN